jgi:predicted molibdopterin-dependent oxidoreductase YjgC
MHIKSTYQRPLFRSEGGNAQATVNVYFNDEPLVVPEGISVAAALLLGGVGCFRTTPVTSAPRAPYCMMGVCFECLVEIDGVAARQACLTLVRAGMKIRRQEGAAQLHLESTKDGEVHEH